MHLLHNIRSHEPVGSAVQHYGYRCEVRADGEVWADIPESLLAVELEAGRTRAAKPSVKPADSVPSQPEAPTEPEAAEETLEQLQVPSAQVVAVDGDTKPAVDNTAKIDGRTKAGKKK